MSDIKQFYLQAPPIARTFALAVFTTSLGMYMGVLPGAWFYFDFGRIIRFPPEIWRLFTSFLLTGPQLSVLFDTYFVFTYLSQLETGHSKFPRKEDLLWYMMIVGAIILLIGNLVLGSAWFLQGLILALVYTATQDQRGQKASFFFFTVPAQLIPLCMIGVSALMSGPTSIFIQLVGLFAAHLHDFVTRLYPEFGGARNILETPAFMSRLANTSLFYQHIPGAVAQPSRPAGGGSASGSGSSGGSGGGVLPDSWRSRGQGQRLG